MYMLLGHCCSLPLHFAIGITIFLASWCLSIKVYGYINSKNYEVKNTISSQTMGC